MCRCGSGYPSDSSSFWRAVSRPRRSLFNLLPRLFSKQPTLTLRGASRAEWGISEADARRIDSFDLTKWKQIWKRDAFDRSRISEDVFWNFLDYRFYTSSFHPLHFPQKRKFQSTQKVGHLLTTSIIYEGFSWVCYCHSNVLIFYGCNDLWRKSSGLGLRSGRTDGWMCTRMRERRCPENWISLASAS